MIWKTSKPFKYSNQRNSNDFGCAVHVYYLHFVVLDGYTKGLHKFTNEHFKPPKIKKKYI